MCYLEKKVLFLFRFFFGGGGGVGFLIVGIVVAVSLEKKSVQDAILYLQSILILH